MRRTYREAAAYMPDDEKSCRYDRYYDVYKHIKVTLKQALENLPQNL